MNPWRALIIVCAVLGLCLFVAGEVIVRLSAPLLRAQSPTYYYREYVQRLVVLDEHLVWRGRPNARELVSNSENREIEYRTQAGGWREEGEPRGGVLVLGDSFTFGTGVAADERFGSRLSQALGMPVFHAGVMGWAPDQYLLVADQLLSHKGWRALVVQLSNNDVSDIADHAWRPAGGSLPESLALARPMPFAGAQGSEFLGMLGHFRRLLAKGQVSKDELNNALARLLRCLDAIAAKADALGVPVVFLQASDWGASAYGQEVADAYQKRVTALAARRGIPLLTPHAHFTLAQLLPFPDLHWRPETHAIVAFELSQVIRRLPPAASLGAELVVPGGRALRK